MHKVNCAVVGHKNRRATFAVDTFVSSDSARTHTHTRSSACDDQYANLCVPGYMLYVT